MQASELLRWNRCELLQNVYLCSSKHNWMMALLLSGLVVNCFKMCIFAVASTISCSAAISVVPVVNCFKMCIFAVASTIVSKREPSTIEL